MRTKLTMLFPEFFRSEEAAGIVLVVCTLGSIAVANSGLGQSYLNFWHTPVGVEIGNVDFLKFSLGHWVNDGLMAIFFLLIGLEIEREFYLGELSKPKNAILPIIAAAGGMAIPALLYLLLNVGTGTPRGAGIPMATDIAFAVGVLALLGKKIPYALKVFLTALAIIDDLGTIVVIAVFYLSNFSFPYLLAALGVYAVLLLMNRAGVQWLPLYLVPGLVMWYLMLRSGVHATVAGVLLAFAIPFGRGDHESPSYKLQHFLHKPVTFLIMPLFALANTGIALRGGWAENLLTTNAGGIFAGLVVGKPLGIALFSYLAVRFGVAHLPRGVGWRHIIGTGFLGGIGFTMSIFITMLAFGEESLIVGSKISILVSSLVAGAIGFFILNSRGDKTA